MKPAFSLPAHGLIVLSLLLGACGGASGGGGSSASASADCPPAQKGNGIMVSSRYDYEDLMEANQWRTEMFPRSCAGSLADYVPDLPNGYGVRPTNRPYIMKDDQVYVVYAEMPDPLYLEEDMPNNPPDIDSIEYEIVRFTDEEMSQVKDWMAANPDAYLERTVGGEPVYLMGGFGTGRPGKGDRLATSLHAFPGDNVVVRVSHRSLFNQRGGLTISPLVQTIMGDIITRVQDADR